MNDAAVMPTGGGTGQHTRGRVCSPKSNRYRVELERLALPRFAPRVASYPFIVAIEGPNGAGKTTLCRPLARSLGAHACLGTPPAWCSKPFKARMIRDAEWFASAMFFLSGCFEQMRALQARSGRLVIMDRSLWSTLAVHAGENSARLEMLLAMLAPIAAQVRVPDLTLVLEASFETCLARIARKNRTAQALDHLTANARFHAREQAFYHWLGRHDPRVQTLDVNEANPRQVADRAKTIIQAALPTPDH